MLNVDEFFRFLAVDALIGNQEGGLQSGRADDVSLYRGVVDPRFRFIPHDMDDVFDIGSGSGNPITRSIFSYDFAFNTSTPNTGVLGFNRILSNAQLLPRYYAALVEGLNTYFNHAALDPLIDQIMAGWVPAVNGGATPPNDSIAEIKAFIDARRANLLTQIPQGALVLANDPAAYSLNVSTAAPNTTEGYKQTTDGAATFSGNFNVAKTSSITVNGQLAQWFYRPSGTDAAGTWKFVAPAGGGTLRPGLNKVVVNFWDGINGTGNVLQSRSADVFYNVPGTTVSGTLTAGSMRLTAPSSYIPGKPFLARVELLDTAGNVDRTAWDTTVTLSSNASGITLPSVQLYNGSGSALVTAGGGGGGAPTVFFSYGTGGTGTATVSGVGGSVWRTKTDFTTTTLASFISSSGTAWRGEGFNDSSWVTRTTQTGFGDGDENQTFANTDYDPGTAGTQSGPAFLFRNTFTIADVNAIASVTGEVKYDDGAIVYVNGNEVARSSNLVGKNALTDYADVTGTTENATTAFTVPAAFLHNGVNTIAVEVHQHDSGSSDATFDLQLQANFPSANPGNFTLTASGGGFSAQKAIASLGATPPMTLASGTLPAGTTNWSGVIHVTGDVTVPAGATLNIVAGTHVLLDGDATAGSTTGKRIIVNGTFNALGTLANPVAITAFNATDRWGGFSFNNAQPSTFNYTLLNHAGHTTGVGHTSKGPMLRIAGSNVSLLDSTLADGPAKALYTSGTCNLLIQRSLIERMITGPELEDGCSLLCEDSNIQRILPDFRESNDAALQ